MDIKELEFFYKSLKEVVKASDTTYEDISMQLYLALCVVHDIDGWTRWQILQYPSGWSKLKKEVKALFEPEEVKKNTVIHESQKDSDGVSLTSFLTMERPLVDYYADFIKEYNYAPTLSTFKKYVGKINKDEFTSMSDFDNEYRKRYPDLAKRYLFDKKTWNNAYKKEFYETIQKYKKFVFVSVGSFGYLDIPFLKSLKRYAEYNKAMIIGIPLFKKCTQCVSDFCISPEIRNYMWVTFEDIKLNDNLMVQVLKANCTTKSTLTGLNQLVASYDSSIIVGGINQQLKYIPVMKHKTPYMIGSTGCCTNYKLIGKDDTVIIPTKAEKLAQDRLSIKGGLVVELGQHNTFNCRNIEANKEDGSFIDLAMLYHPLHDPVEVNDSLYIIGDLHVPYHNKELLKASIKAIKDYRCSRVVLHDSVNMAYVSHHNADKAIVKAQMVEEGRADILGEIGILSNILRELNAINSIKEIIIPHSNHPAHLEGFIQDIGRMVKDDINLRTSLHVALAMLDGKNVLQYLVEEVMNCKLDKIDWVPEDASREIYGVQVGLHGSEKVNGGKMTTTSTNNAFRKTVVAHRHSAGIDGDTITVGIACERDQGYNKGLSSWTESNAIVYPNGKAQLLTFFNMKGILR